VNHHTIVAETAAANRRTINAHEPIHPTGRRREYPNLMTREGVKGPEYDSFGTISPEHHVTFPFTRTFGAVDAGGAPLTDAEGDTVAPAVDVDSDANTVTLSIDRGAFDGVDLADLEAVVVIQSEDRGTLRPVAETAADYRLGGAKPGAVENTPLITDLVTPEEVSRADALADSADQRATLPFVSLD